MAVEFPKQNSHDDFDPHPAFEMDQTPNATQLAEGLRSSQCIIVCVLTYERTPVDYWTHCDRDQKALRKIQLSIRSDSWVISQLLQLFLSSDTALGERPRRNLYIRFELYYTEVQLAHI